ncbi:hypothetical protein AAFN88_04220 [Pelagibius sp. CAU 1746]|uniref:hypothetical protein n=1 Tax=Pelagibius sp. CAU 1746 TaxID=3140370 RepID=UPI00325BBF1F
MSEGLLIALLINLPVIAFLVGLHAPIAKRAGFSGWWCLAMLVPGVNVIVVWLFAFIRWPKLDGPEGAEEGAARP